MNLSGWRHKLSDYAEISRPDTGWVAKCFPHHSGAHPTVLSSAEYDGELRAHHPTYYCGRQRACGNILNRGVIA